jgi:hypothetical protein
VKKILFAALLLSTATVVLAADLGVSVSIGQPGFYGQIDIGGYPPPQVIYRQPRAIYQVDADRPPIYLRVPPGHARNWRKYCGRYNACDERVFFVNNNWYQREYSPRYQERHFERRDGYQDGRSDERPNWRPDDRRDQQPNEHRQDERNHHQNEGRNHGNNR